MREIALAAVPNQSLSVTLDGNRWDLRIKLAVTSMICDVTRNDVRLLSGVRIVAGTPIIPYKYMQGTGNFMLLTQRDELPDWQRFGVDQDMIYASAEEIAAIPAAALDYSPEPAAQVFPEEVSYRVTTNGDVRITSSGQPRAVSE